MNCDELARVWPEKYPRPGAETNKQNGLMIRKFGRDFAGRAPESIDRDEARQWALANLGRARFVRTMFNDLLADGKLDENVFAGLKLPAVGSEPVVVPTEAQVEALTGYAEGNGQLLLASMIDFAAYTGLRQSEQLAVLCPGEGAPGDRAALGNVWGKAERLKIDWQLGRDGKLRPPKTKRSLRTIFVPRTAREAALSAVQSRSTRSAFLWAAGRTNQKEAWSGLRRETGIWVKWHDLRHHAATWFLDHGATVDDVAVQLGCHPDQIRDTYGHPNAELALGRLEGLVGG